MEFKQLESFITVLDMQSFSKAAEKLFVTQPTVSTQIATLERELDTQLLIRSSKDIQPTREGRIFYRYAKEILDKRNQALLSFQNLKNPIGGVITIAASSIPIRHYLPPLIAAFQRQVPSISFRVYLYDSVEIIETLSNGKIEIGMTGIYVPSSICDSQCMAYDRWIVITPNNTHYRNLINSRSFSLSYITQERFICRERGSATRKDMDHFLVQLGIDLGKINIIAEIDDTDSIIEMVAQGVGISIVSQRAAESYCQHGKILSVDFEKIIPSREIYLVRNQNIALSVPAQRFYDFALKFYQQ